VALETAQVGPFGKLVVEWVLVETVFIAVIVTFSA
jgi:hypothetical protein